jgi:Fe-S oxidoreductase
MFVTEIKLNLINLPPDETGLMVVHLDTVSQALEANLIALKHQPVAIELIDNYILERTKTSKEHSKNRFFLKGEPGALLCVEFAFNNKEEVENSTKALIKELQENGYGYYYPVLYGSDVQKVWALRKAGLGLLANVPGDAKPQPVIEDTAVNPEVLPAYIEEFNLILQKYNLSCVYYAHIATGELHLRPLLNLKTQEGVELFHTLAFEIAKLVKKYRGSLSGEHGDGRLRGEFIPLMIGEDNYQLLKKIKATWDPLGIFNKGKITDTPPMHTSLRYTPGQENPDYDTIFDFSDTQGILRLAEKCNGSADCRKSSIIGGTMCPSYQATHDENTTTRARANMLREILTHKQGSNSFDSKELFDVLDLCLSCKGCKSECPSGIDMAKLKSEFLFQFYRSNFIPLRTRLIANYSRLQSIASRVSILYNKAILSPFFSVLIKRFSGFAPNRSLPTVNSQTFRKWLKKNINKLNKKCSPGSPGIYLFVDEFTNYNDLSIGIITVKLLNSLGYHIRVLNNVDSGRPYISKGFLIKARKLAKHNVKVYKEHVNENCPLIGIEPSAILTFRDEYPDLLKGFEKDASLRIASNTYTIEEFISNEATNGRIVKERFTREAKQVFFHGHCQQKAISSTLATKKILQLPENYLVEEIKSGCCGMAGSFGYEKEHYDLSMNIGELVLFPAIRKLNQETIVVASGTSCRHQIKDGTSVKVYHPVEVLYAALNREE